ncbi:MAG: hypothetical protein ABSG70_14410 [Terriglobales bacterium]|jgi:hypothetical protein
MKNTDVINGFVEDGPTRAAFADGFVQHGPAHGFVMVLCKAPGGFVQGFVEGHGFSRAVAINTIRGFSPGGDCREILPREGARK